MLVPVHVEQCNAMTLFPSHSPIKPKTTGVRCGRVPYARVNNEVPRRSVCGVATDYSKIAKYRVVVG